MRASISPTYARASTAAWSASSNLHPRGLARSTLAFIRFRHWPCSIAAMRWFSHRKARSFARQRRSAPATSSQRAWPMAPSSSRVEYYHAQAHLPRPNPANEARNRQNDLQRSTQTLWHRRHSRQSRESPHSIQRRFIAWVSRSRIHCAKSLRSRRVIFGRDTRESGPWIAATLAEGLRQAGAPSRAQALSPRRQSRSSRGRMASTPASSSPLRTIRGRTTASSFSAATDSSFPTLPSWPWKRRFCTTPRR